MERSGKTLQTLRDGLLRLMGKYSFDEVSVTRLVTECGYSRQNFYKNFSDKYALVQEIFERDCREGVGEESFFVWRRDTPALLSALKRNAKLYRGIVRSSARDWLFELFVSYGEIFFHAFAEYSVFRRLTEEQEQDLGFYLAGATVTLFRWFEAPERMSEARLSKLFLEGLPGALSPFLAEEMITTDYLFYKIKRKRQGW